MAVDIVAEIIKREGGYVDHPADRGGATNFGVTAHTFKWWRNDPNADVRTLTEREAREILTDIYLVRPKIDLLPVQIRACVADWAVNSGPQVAIMGLQRALGVPGDGKIGPQTLTAASLAPQGPLLAKLVAERVKMIGRIIQKSPNQAIFLVGWLDRALSFLG